MQAVELLPVAFGEERELPPAEPLLHDPPEEDGILEKGASSEPLGVLRNAKQPFEADLGHPPGRDRDIARHPVERRADPDHDGDTHAVLMARHEELLSWRPHRDSQDFESIRDSAFGGLEHGEQRRTVLRLRDVVDIRCNDKMGLMACDHGLNRGERFGPSTVADADAENETSLLRIGGEDAGDLAELTARVGAASSRESSLQKHGMQNCVRLMWHAAAPSDTIRAVLAMR